MPTCAQIQTIQMLLATLTEQNIVTIIQYSSDIHIQIQICSIFVWLISQHCRAFCNSLKTVKPSSGDKEEARHANPNCVAYKKLKIYKLRSAKLLLSLKTT